MYMEEPSTHAESSVADIVMWTPTQLLSCHQQMESSLVELLNLLTEWMMRRAARKREEARRNATLTIGAQMNSTGTSPAPVPFPSPSHGHGHGRSVSQSVTTVTDQGAFAIAAATGARIHSARHTHQSQSYANNHNVGANASTPSSNVLPTSPVPSIPFQMAPDPEESATFSSFLSHFHLLSHLIPQLRVSSLEHMLHFLLPADGTDTSASSDSMSSRRGGAGMALCYSLLDAHTQTQLIELIVHAYLHIVHLREKTEVGEYEHESPEKSEGEVEVSPGTEGLHAQIEINRSSDNYNRPSRAYQLRLLHVLHKHSGEYRLSHVLPRCVDYHNWIAAAVAIESSQAGTTSSEKQSTVSSLQLASGLWRHGSGSHLSDAMECRLKHLNQRIQIWQQWKQRSNAPPLPVHPPHCVGSLEMIDVGCIPRFPSDVWLSFDEFSVETAQLFLQLVPSHLIHIVNIAEQARLLSLLLQGWRAVDLPSVVLESVLLSNLASLADALSVLAFQPKSNSTNASSRSTNGQQRIAEDTSNDSLATTNTLPGLIDASSPIAFAPIFSAKLYLALTHYRLNQVYRSGDSISSSGPSLLADSLNGISMRDTGSSTGRGSSSPFAHSAPPLTSSPHGPSGASLPNLPSLSQTQRLWSEILSNLHRDLDVAGDSNSSASSGSSIVNSAMPAASTSFQLSAPTPASVSYLSPSAFLYKYAPVSATPTTSSPNSIRSSISRTASQSGFPSESGRSVMVFTCGHAYLIAEFMSHVLPELMQQLCALSPPLPITANFLHAEYTHGVKPQAQKDGAGSTPTSRVCALACPCCVFASLLQLQQRRAQTVQKTVFMQQQQQNERLARLQQPSATSVGLANVSSPSNMMIGSTSPSTSVPSPQQRKHAIGLSMTGNIPKLQFGRVSAADLTEDR